MKDLRVRWIAIFEITRCEKQDDRSRGGGALEKEAGPEMHLVDVEIAKAAIVRRFAARSPIGRGGEITPSNRRADSDRGDVGQPRVANKREFSINTIGRRQGGRGEAASTVEQDEAGAKDGAQHDDEQEDGR